MTKILIDEAVVRQALDAVESFADGSYYENEEDDIGRRFCCDVLSYKPHKENCAAAASAAALRQVIEQPAPVQPITQAVHTLIQAMQDDPEYAWSWHCNIAMAFVDAGGDRYTANQGAARFLELFAKVQPAHELPTQPAPAQEPTKEMIDAAERIDWSDSDVRGNIVNMWQAMCAVAPPAEPDPDELTIAYLNGIDTGKKRKPLTDEQIKDVAASCMWWVREQDILDDAIELARAIEAAHGIKGNT